LNDGVWRPAYSSKRFSRRPDLPIPPYLDPGAARAKAITSATAGYPSPASSGTMCWRIQGPAPIARDPIGSDDERVRHQLTQAQVVDEVHAPITGSAGGERAPGFNAAEAPRAGRPFCALEPRVTRPYLRKPQQRRTR